MPATQHEQFFWLPPDRSGQYTTQSKAGGIFGVTLFRIRFFSKGTSYGHYSRRPELRWNRLARDERPAPCRRGAATGCCDLGRSCHRRAWLSAGVSELGALQRLLAEAFREPTEPHDGGKIDPLGIRPFFPENNHRLSAGTL